MTEKEFREAIEQQLEFFDKNPKLAKKYIDEFVKRVRDRRMTKELEHLKIIEDWANEHHDSKEVWEHSIPVQEALQRLESIDNANPSEAMKCLEKMMNFAKSDLDSIPQSFYDLCVKKNKEIDNIVDVVKQALLKAQEQEKEYKELKENVKRWHDLLLKSGIDSKGLVINDIEEYWAIKAGV